MAAQSAVQIFRNSVVHREMAWWFVGLVATAKRQKKRIIPIIQAHLAESSELFLRHPWRRIARNLQKRRRLLDVLRRLCAHPEPSGRRLKFRPN